MGDPGVRLHTGPVDGQVELEIETWKAAKTPTDPIL